MQKALTGLNRGDVKVYLQFLKSLSKTTLVLNGRPVMVWLVIRTYSASVVQGRHGLELKGRHGPFSPAIFIYNNGSNIGRKRKINTRIGKTRFFHAE